RYCPLFQSLFAFDKPRDASEASPLGPGDSASQDRLRLEPLIYGQQGAPFDLTLRMIEVEGSLSADLRYNVELFEATTMARMQQHFLTLLQGLVTDPGQRITDLPILTQAEQRQLLAWNDTHSEYPDQVCLHQLIEQQVQRTPEAPAVVFEDQQLTYREVNCRANQLAHALQAR